MCYAKLKVIVEGIPAKISINKFCKTRNVSATYMKLKLTFLGPGCTQCCAGQLEDKLHCLKYKGKFKNNKFQMYIACHQKIFQQMHFIKANGYAWICSRTHVHYFLRGIDEPSLKTALQICESQVSYSINFHAWASYLTPIVQKTSVTKWVHISAADSEVNGVKHKNRDCTDWCLPLQSIWEVSIRCSPPNRKRGSCKTARRPRPMGKTSQWQRRDTGSPPAQQTKCLESAVMSHISQINSLTAQNQNIAKDTTFQLPQKKLLLLQKTKIISTGFDSYTKRSIDVLNFDF